MLKNLATGPTNALFSLPFLFSLVGKNAIFVSDENWKYSSTIILSEHFIGYDLIDIVFKALVRAELRLISRFVIEASYEERLTGNLVFEILNSIIMVREDFEKVSEELYRKVEKIDLEYTDASRSGRVESKTGADLAFIVPVNLPDYLKGTRSVYLQAKKIYENETSVSLPVEQKNLLKSHKKDGAGYLFYDMHVDRLLPPVVKEVSSNEI